MKVILKKDVKSLGKAGEIVEAANGYARNYLIPRGLAVGTSSNNMNDLKLMQENIKKVAAQNLADAQETAAKLSGASVSIPMKFGDNGKAFGSVTTKEIAAAISEQLGMDIDKRRIHLVGALKEAGPHEVPIKLHQEVTANLQVILTEEK